MANTNNSGTIAADTQIAERIKALIDKAGTSENALAEAAAISQKTLNRRLKGVGPFTIQEVGRLAAALNTTAAELVAA
jgi:transcriptional regulator with XRE-family HTH domain